MTEIELNNEYFEWMCQLVCNERYSRRLSYQKLLRHLHNIDFQYMLPMDGNRAEDGIDLRYRFGYEKEYEGPMIASYLDNRPCSVLEMLIALAFRCEEHMAKELGDVAWYLAVSANAIGYDFETIMQMNVDKLKARYPDGFDAEHSLHRNQDDI